MAKTELVQQVVIGDIDVRLAVVVKVEDEHSVKGAQAVDVGRVKPARRVGEAQLADTIDAAGAP